MNDYKQECFKRLEYTQKYSKYNKEDLIEEIIEKDKQLDKYKNVIDKIDKLINTDYGLISYYYKYNNKYLKSEIKEDINKLLEEVNE